MNCARVDKLICDYIGDCLSTQLRREVEAHLSECASCRAEVEAAERMVGSLGDLSVSRSPVDCWPAIKQRIAERESRQTGWLSWLVRPVVAAPTFAVAMLLLALFLWPQVGETPGRDAEPFSDYAQYVTAHSRLQRQQALTDPDVTFIAAEFEKASLASDSR